MCADSAVRLVGVVRAYPSGSTEVRAVNGVTLEVARSEVVAIAGPSGSGKTTLLNLIAGLDRPTEGEVRVLGQLLTGLSEKRLTAFRARSLGLVFQEPHLLPGLTALENVVVARLPWGKWRALGAEARELLGSIGLADRMHFPPSRLSGGERQRVGLARALLGGPELLLADEPTGNLDSGTTEDILALLHRLRAERGFTLVVATHDPAVAAMAGRVLHMAGGRLDGEHRTGEDTGLEIHSLD